MVQSFNRALLGGTMRRQMLVGVAALVLMATGCVTVERVDTSSNGSQTAAGVTTFVPTFPTSGSGISGDGRFAVFASTATDLVAGVTDGNAHVYRKDRQTGAIAVADLSSSGTPSGGAVAAAISDDGTRVAFRTGSKLVVADVDTHIDAYVRDFTAGTTILASLMPDGTQTPSGLGAGVFDADFDGTGAKLLFLVGAGTIPERNRIELRDLAASSTTQILGDSQVSDVLFSRDGQHVFANTTCFQVGGCSPTPLLIDISHPYPSTPMFGSGARAAGISDDGRYVLFQRGPVVFDRTTGTSVAITIGSAPTNAIEVRSLDGSGRFAVVSAPDDSLPGGTAGHTGLFLVDVITGRVERTSADAANRASNGTSEGAAATISRDGRTVSFFSEASNLVFGDGNAKQDAFVRVGPTPVVLSVTGGNLARGVSHTVVTVHGAEFFGPFSATVSGAGVIVNSVAVNATNDQVVLDVSVSASAPTGSRSLTVANLAAVGHAGTVCGCLTIT